MTKKNPRKKKKVNKQQQMKVNHKIIKKVVETVFSEVKKVIVTKKINKKNHFYYSFANLFFLNIFFLVANIF